MSEDLMLMILEKAVQCPWYMTNPRAYCVPDRDHQKSCPAAVIIVVRVCRHGNTPRIIATSCAA